MKYLQIILLTFLITGCKSFQKTITISYTADTVTIFANPGRGWYFSYTTYCCDKTVKTACSETPELINGPHGPLRAGDLQISCLLQGFETWGYNFRLVG
jgi:hypothetical protein